MLEKLLEEINFDADERAGETVKIMADWLPAQLAGLAVNGDLSKSILYLAARPIQRRTP